MKTDGPPIDYKFLKTVGNRIKRLREELTDYSVEEFAQKVEIDPEWLKGIEEGKVDAKILDLKHIADYFPDIDVHDLMGGTF